MKRLSAALMLVMTLAAGLSAVDPAAAQGTRPAFCNAVNLNMYYGYQYDANVRKAWDDLNVQYANVCVMLDTTRSTAGCDVTIQNPWYTAGGLGTAPLCWYGRRTTPVVSQVQPPAGCFPTSLGPRRAYSDPAIRALWDQWRSEVSGVCESTTSRPNDCKYLIEEGGGKYLCFWPNKPNIGLLAASVDRNGIVDAANAALAIGEVCQLVGAGTVVFEFRIGDQIIQLLVRDCKVQDVQWLTPPENCAAADPYAYVVIPKATVDLFMSDSRGACTMFRQPTQGECNHTVQLTSQLVMCFWGQPKVLAGAFLGEWRFRISMDKAAFRSILNAGDRANQAANLIRGGQIAINGNSFQDQLTVQAALKLLGDNIPVTPYVPGTTAFTSPDGNLGFVVNAGRYGGPDTPDDVLLGITPQGEFLMNDDGAVVGAFNPSFFRLEPLLSSPGVLRTETRVDLEDGVSRDRLSAITSDALSTFTLSQPAPAIERMTYTEADARDLRNKGVTPVQTNELDLVIIMLTGRSLDSFTEGGMDSVPPPGSTPPIESVLQDLGPIRMVDIWTDPKTGENTLIGPRGPVSGPSTDSDGAPIESVLDDLSPCRVICSVTPQTNLGAPAARPYVAGATNGMWARNTLAAGGVAVV